MREKEEDEMEELKNNRGQSKFFLGDGDFRHCYDLSFLLFFLSLFLKLCNNGG